MRIHKLTIPAQRIVQRLDAGKHQPLSVEEVVDALQDGSIFELLCERMDLMVPLSILTPIDRLELLMEWQEFELTYTPGEIGVTENGFQWVLYFLLEGIQRRMTTPEYGGLTGEAYGV